MSLYRGQHENAHTHTHTEITLHSLPHEQFPFSVNVTSSKKKKDFSVWNEFLWRGQLVSEHARCVLRDEWRVMTLSTANGFWFVVCPPLADSAHFSCFADACKLGLCMSKHASVHLQLGMSVQCLCKNQIFVLWYSCFPFYLITYFSDFQNFTVTGNFGFKI